MIKELIELGQEIEKLPASEQQTKVSMMVNKLLDSIKCPKCGQEIYKDSSKPGLSPCSECGQNLVWDDEIDNTDNSNFR
jgi:predicted RNA-binding Zn-ribbon protein involved in translation (DUF1610 family)